MLDKEFKVIKTLTRLDKRVDKLSENSDKEIEKKR